MMGGASLYVRHPGLGPATAVRATSEGGSTGAPFGLRSSAPGASPAPAGISLYRLAQDLRDRAAPTTTTRAPVPATTVVARPPDPATTTTTAAGAPATTSPPTLPPTTTPLTPLTTILARLAPPVAAALGAPARSDGGQASWFHAPDGTCAHRDLPLGTLIRVTRPSTGASATCRVNDRGPSAETNRVIDLSLDTFEKLASSDAGVIAVRIEW
jgi:hypothetical protein